MARMLIDEDGREVTFVEYRAECERVAAGFQELGVTDGTVVSWQLPTWIESFVLVGALESARRDAEPDPSHLPGARGRLRRQADRREVPARAGGVARLRLRGDGAVDREGHARASRCSS